METWKQRAEVLVASGFGNTIGSLRVMTLKLFAGRSGPVVLFSRAAELTLSSLDHPDKQLLWIKIPTCNRQCSLIEDGRRVALLSHDTFGDNRPTPTFVMRNHTQFHLHLALQRMVPYVSST